jgi:hypothetical protein
MIRHSIAFAVCTLTLLACAGGPPAQTAPVPMSFTTRTLPDSIIEGSFTGTLTMKDGWMDVVVTSGELTFPPGPAERWRSLTVRSFVATDYAKGSWKTAAESTPVNMWQFIDFPRGAPQQSRITIAIKNALHFKVPVPPGASLATSRIGFEMEWVTLFKDYGQTEANFSFSAPLSASRPPNQ